MAAPARPLALCPSAVCHLHKRELVRSLCSPGAPGLLQGLQTLSDAQVRPGIVASQLCCAAVAPGEAARLRLGSFLAQQQQGNEGRVRRIVCACSAPCLCGRWQSQSTERIPFTGPDPCVRYTVVRETLRWMEWSPESNIFVAGEYMLYSHSLEVEGLELLSQELQSWVGRFQWRQREGCSRITRVTFCQAFFDPPRREAGRRRPRAEGGVSAGRPTRRVRRATHTSCGANPPATRPATLPAPPSPPPRRDLTCILAAAIERIEQERLDALLSADLHRDVEAFFAETLWEQQALLCSGSEGEEADQGSGSGSGFGDLQADGVLVLEVASEVSDLFLTAAGEYSLTDEELLFFEGNFTSGGSFEAGNLEGVIAEPGSGYQTGHMNAKLVSPGDAISAAGVQPQEWHHSEVFDGLSAAAA